MLRIWEPLPDLPETRYYHACDRIDMNNNPYLIVFGGYMLYDQPGYVKFLNLNQKNLGWVNLPGISLSGPSSVILGSIVKQLSPTNCDMMFLEYFSGLNVCEGNFNWTTIGWDSLTPPLTASDKRFVPVGLNAFPTCV